MAGLESVLTLNLVGYANPTQFSAFEDELIGRSTEMTLTREISAAAKRGRTLERSGTGPKA